MNVGLLSSVSALALVGYTGAVIFHGNLMAMLAQLTKDWRFIEVPIAVGIIYALYKVEVLREPIGLLVGVAVLAMLLKLFSTPTAQTAMSDFTAGRKGILETVLSLGSAIK